MATESISPKSIGAAALPDHYDGEQLRISTGTRSGATIIVAVHSTQRGPAMGGCRVRNYPSFSHALADALNLSKAMTYKCAIGDVASGGGKTVVIPPVTFDRRELLLDIGDAVEAMGGIYSTGGDYGTTPQDMIIVKERTSHILGLPVEHGGAGTPAEPTSQGVLAAMKAVSKHLFGTESLAGRHIVISGLGSVGGRMAEALAAMGARLTVTDIDPSKARLAEQYGATWVDPADALTVEAEIVAPASVGGVLDHALVDRLHCMAIVGPANNQLSEPSVADALAKRGILWAPDFLVNAGGAIYAGGMEVERLSRSDVDLKVEAIGSTLTEVLECARGRDVTPLLVATAMAEDRLASKSVARVDGLIGRQQY
jgi:glutamate dehydrogenase/leucine dehydrogenase